MLTRRELFDRVEKHLLKQGKKSIDQDSNTCLYRGEGALRCAIGRLIEDSEYRRLMEGKSITALKIAGYTFKNFDVTDAVTLRMLGALQSIHDHKQPSMWADALKELRKECCLNTP